MVLSFGAGPPGSENDEYNMPQYLEDEDDDMDSPSKDNKQLTLHDKALGVATGWFNSAASFVSGSLYW